MPICINEFINKKGRNGKHGTTNRLSGVASKFYYGPHKTQQKLKNKIATNCDFIRYSGNFTFSIEFCIFPSKSTFSLENKQMYHKWGEPLLDAC